MLHPVSKTPKPGLGGPPKNPEGGRGKGGRREKEEEGREGEKGGEEDPGLGVGIVDLDTDAHQSLK